MLRYRGIGGIVFFIRQEFVSDHSQMLGVDGALSQWIPLSHEVNPHRTVQHGSVGSFSVHLIDL